MSETQRVAAGPRVIRDKENSMKTKHPVRWVVAGVAVIYVVIVSLTHKEKVSPPLDYNMPVYTTDHAILCPMSLLSDPRADHDYHAVLDMFISTFSSESKAEKLGCEVLKGGIRVVATRGPDVLVTVNKVYFTMEAHLTNNADGSMRSADSSPSHSTSASKAENDTFDNSKSYINTAPAAPIPSSNGSGTMLVSSPSSVPMLKGDVNAANLRGFGAVICPDSKAFAAYIDTFDSRPDDKKTTSDIETMRRFGCSYFPPATPMVSEGGDPKGSLVAVKVTLPDGRTISGVTFSNWIVPNEQQTVQVAPQASLAASQPLTAHNQVDNPIPPVRPDVPQQPAPAQVENPTPPAQPPSYTTAIIVDGGHLSTVDNADVKTSKKLNAEGLRLLSATHPDFDEAKQAFEKAVQLDPANIEALNNLGYVYSRIGDYRSAEAVLLKVLAVAPTRRVAHGNLGYAQAKLGKTQEAVNHYCQYVRQFDSLERGKSALVRANAADPDPNVRAAIEATVR